jgi:hypothetical protein
MILFPCDLRTLGGIGSKAAIGSLPLIHPINCLCNASTCSDRNQKSPENGPEFYFLFGNMLKIVHGS